MLEQITKGWQVKSRAGHVVNNASPLKSLAYGRVTLA